MKKLKSILSLSLVAILIFATAGFSVSRHYCLDMLVSESYYGLEAEKCAGHQEDDDCESDNSLLKADCCEDEILSLAGIDVPSPQKSGNFQALFISPAAASQPFALLELRQLSTPQIKANPPPGQKSTGKKVLLWDQRFLI